MARTISHSIYALSICIGINLLSGCQNRPSKFDIDQTNLLDTINKLEQRLEILEKKLDASASSGGNGPSGPIKSLTFRTGSKDDRLRIYWEDGKKSDLPCSKEQSIWICG